MSKELNFNEKFYYLYKLSNLENKAIDINATASTGEIFVDYDSNFEYLDEANYDDDYGTNYNKTITDWWGDEMYILITAKKLEKTTEATIDIKVN